MNRVELKNRAKELIRGNKWYLWKPLIIIGLAIVIIEGIAYGLDVALGLAQKGTIELFGVKSTYTTGGIISGIIGIFSALASAAFSVGYSYYVLSFIRGKKLTINDIINFMKKYWIVAFLTGLLVSLIIFGCTILLVIPGIIAAIGLSYYKEVCADNTNMKATEIVKKSWETTKGHKMDLFVLGLSFIGWNFVAGLTFGILYIWLMPYMLITLTLAYEQIKK